MFGELGRWTICPDPLHNHSALKPRLTRQLGQTLRCGFIFAASGVQCGLETVGKCGLPGRFALCWSIARVSSAICCSRSWMWARDAPGSLCSSSSCSWTCDLRSLLEKSPTAALPPKMRRRPFPRDFGRFSGTFVWVATLMAS